MLKVKVLARIFQTLALNSFNLSLPFHQPKPVCIPCWKRMRKMKPKTHNMLLIPPMQYRLGQDSSEVSCVWSSMLSCKDMVVEIGGLTIKSANLPPCADMGSAVQTAQ